MILFHALLLFQHTKIGLHLSHSELVGQRRPQSLHHIGLHISSWTSTFILFKKCTWCLGCLGLKVEIFFIGLMTLIFRFSPHKWKVIVSINIARMGLEPWIKLLSKETHCLTSIPNNLLEKIFQSQIEGSDYSLDENKH